MAVAKKQPDRLTRVTTKRDGDEGKIIVAEGTPLARLQAIHEDPEATVLAGDLNDVLAICDPKDEIVAKLVKTAGKAKKSDPITVAVDEVEYITALLVNNHKRSQTLAV